MILLFLIVICFHCDEEKVSVKSEDLDYSTADFWWSGTPRFNATDVMTPPYPFMPTPKGHGRIVFPVIIENNSYTWYPPNHSFPILETGKIFPRPDFTVAIQYPGITIPPNFPSDYKFPIILPTLISTARYIPSPTGPTPKGPSFTLPDVQRTIFFYPTGPPTTPPTTDWVSPSPLPSPRLNVTWDPVSLYLQLWKKKLASDAAFGGTPRGVVPVIRSIVNYDWKLIV